MTGEDGAVGTRPADGRTQVEPCHVFIAGDGERLGRWEEGHGSGAKVVLPLSEGEL